MAIISRILESVQSADGTVLASFLAVDDKGREWRRSRSRFQDQAAAQTALDAFDWAPQLKDREEQDAVAFIEGGGDPDAFVLSDLGTTEYRRRLAKRFAQAVVDQDRKFVCAIATWVSGFTADQIANALGISLARATKIRDRAVRLRDEICPRLALDDGDIEAID